MTWPVADPSTPPVVHREMVVDPRCPHQVAVAFTRYRMTRPSFVVLTVIEIVLLVAFLATSEFVLAVIFAALVLVVPISVFATVRKMEKLLSTRGYRPGATVGVDYYDDRLVVTTAVAVAPHHYREIRGFTERGGIVTIQTLTKNYIILLPSPLVPEQVRPMLAATAN